MHFCVGIWETSTEEAPTAEQNVWQWTGRCTCLGLADAAHCRVPLCKAFARWNWSMHSCNRSHARHAENWQTYRKAKLNTTNIYKYHLHDIECLMYWRTGESLRLQGVEAGQCVTFQPCLSSILPSQTKGTRCVGHVGTTQIQTYCSCSLLSILFYDILCLWMGR